MIVVLMRMSGTTESFRLTTVKIRLPFTIVLGNSSSNLEKWLETRLRGRSKDDGERYDCKGREKKWVRPMYVTTENYRLFLLGQNPNAGSNSPRDKLVWDFVSDEAFKLIVWPNHSEVRKMSIYDSLSDELKTQLEQADPLQRQLLESTVMDSAIRIIDAQMASAAAAVPDGQPVPAFGDGRLLELLMKLLEILLPILIPIIIGTPPTT